MSAEPCGRRAIFLDRDGVLNVDTGYVYRPEDFLWTKGAMEAVRSINVAGHLGIVITNQSGVGRGLYTEEDVANLHNWMQVELAAAGARIDAFYHCPYIDSAVVERYRVKDHPDRKPNPGMILRAIRDWRIDPARSFLIGDKESDLKAAERAGVPAKLFEGGHLGDFVREILSAHP